MALSPEEITDSQTFWAKNGGWICKNCHDTCYDCSGPLETDCYICRYSDSVHKPSRILGKNGENISPQEEPEKFANFITHDDETQGPIRMMQSNGKCYNCSISFKELPEMCLMTKDLKLIKADRPIDGFSSISVRINLGNDKPELNSRLMELKWNELLGLEIEGMVPETDYTHRFDFFKGQLYASINFTKDGKIETINVRALNNTILSSPDKFIPEIRTPDFLLSKEVASLQIVARKAEESETIKKYSGKGGIDFSGMSAITNTISGFLLVVSLLASSGAMAGPILNMIKVFKLVYNLRLINVYFGNILEAFLTALSEGFGNSAKGTDLQTIYFTKSRGKLTVYNIGVLSNYYMHVGYLMVFITRILGFMSEHFKKKIRTAASLEYSHLLIVDLIEMVRTSIFYSTIYDIALYSVHELLHHDLTINQTSLAKTSYFFAFGVLIIAIVELQVSFNTLKNFDTEKFLKENEKKKEIDKIINDEKIDIKTRYQSMLQRDEFEKQFNYVFGMSLMFFIAGLETTKMKPLALRTVKFWSIMKTVVFFILINCLQTAPVIQVTIIMLI